MAADGEAAAEIGRQIALMRRRVAQRGVLGYLVREAGASVVSRAACLTWAWRWWAVQDDDGERKDVNKLFLHNTVRRCALYGCAHCRTSFS